MNFEEKVRLMTAKEIIMAMVEALTHPPIMNVRMSTWGHTKVTYSGGLFGLFRKKNVKCFGCAATNTLCKISGITPEKLLDKASASRNTDAGIRAENLKTDYAFLYHFERAINHLRIGCIRNYNEYAVVGQFAQIKEVEGLELPVLNDDYTNEHLIPYKLLAEGQE